MSHKVFSLCVLFCVYVLSYSQNIFNKNGEREGNWRGYHANGVIKYEGRFFNGEEVGLFKYYDWLGNLAIELNYVDTGSKSQAILYYVNGTIKSRGQYVNKKKDGLWIYYNDVGNKISQENYQNGLLNGESIYYHLDGKVAEIYPYVNNEKHGGATVFYKSGDLNMKCFYVHGKKNGLAEFYYNSPSKQLESKGIYLLGVKDSIWNFYNEEGDLMQKIEYKNGVIKSK